MILLLANLYDVNMFIFLDSLPGKLLLNEDQFVLVSPEPEHLPPGTQGNANSLTIIKKTVSVQLVINHLITVMYLH